MNEELKIIIKAVTSEAEKGISKVKKGLGDMGKTGGKGFAALASGAKVAAVGIAAAGAAVAAVGAALVNASKSSQDFRKSMAQLTSGFQAAGGTAQQAQKTYEGLYRFLGETDTAVEAANQLAKLTTNEQHLAEWTKALQGVYATFPDSLPIESLAEAANETAQTAKVTGTLADALNWAGVSEDAFNAQLAQTNSQAEREALIRQTLNGLYGDAAALYEKNAAEILAQNEAQNRLNIALAEVGRAATPLLTALTNLSSALLTLLAPAVNAIIPYFAAFINAISKAVGWVNSFITALTGKKAAVQTTQQIAKGINTAATGTKKLASGLGSAVKEAEKLKKVTAGFDELNVLSTSSSSSGSSGGGSGAADGGSGGLGAISGGGLVDVGVTDAMDAAGGSVERFAARFKAVFGEIKNAVIEWASLFTPSLEAWGSSFDIFMEYWGGIKEAFTIGGLEMGAALSTLGGYILNDFVPSVVNSFSENLAPIISEWFGFALEQAGLNFQTFAETINSAVQNVILPALDTLKTIFSDTLGAIKKAWDENSDNLLSKATVMFDGIREIWQQLYKDIIEPTLSKIVKFINEVWKETLKPLVDDVLDAVMAIIDLVLTLWNNVLKPVISWVLSVLSPIIDNWVTHMLETFKNLFRNLGNIVSGLLGVIKGLATFLTGVFSADWKKAWEGIKQVFSGVWKSLKSIVALGLNTTISTINGMLKGLTMAVNTLIKGINKIKIDVPDWLGGGKLGFSLKEWKAPQIPYLAKGGIVNSATLAMIGERGKEAVLPLENNTEWIDKLAEAIAGKNKAPSKIVLMLDGKELGYATCNALNNIYKQTGNLPLALV